MALCVCFSTTAYAQEMTQKESEFPQENVTVQLSSNVAATEGEMSDLYEEVLRTGANSEYIPNNMERPYDGAII